MANRLDEINQLKDHLSAKKYFESFIRLCVKLPLKSFQSMNALQCSVFKLETSNLNYFEMVENALIYRKFIAETVDIQTNKKLMFKTYSAFVSGVGKSPIVVNVSVDQYKLPKYFLVSVA